MSMRLGITLHAVSVRRGDTWALRNVSLRLRAGERWALIGGNGAGKTQLLKLIGTAVWPTPTGHETRIYRVGRRDVDVIEAKRRIAYVGAELQDKYARYEWNLDVGDLLATGLQRTDLLLQPVTRDGQRRVSRMLERCGLTMLAGRKFLSLSYGQKRLALLARALVQEPDWLLLDEFYNGLDPDFRRRIDDVLGQACVDGQSWISAAHRAADVPRGTKGLIELRAGKVLSVKGLRGADLARLAKHADEPLLPARSGPQAPRRTIRFASQPLGRPSFSADEPSMRPVPNARAAKRGPRPGAPSGGEEVLVRIANADLYVDYRAVLRDVNWELRAGQHWAVVGANGAGKSSFLKLLYGDLSPASGGRIERSGFPRGTPIDEWKRQVGYISPELQTDHAIDVSVFDVVASGRYASIGLNDEPTAADRANARRWLEFFALLAVARRRPRELSYGQLRRALFARALAGEPRILLLDEPLTGLDPRQRAAMKRLLERLMTQGLTLVIAVHHPEDLPRGMTHVLRLHNHRAEALDLESAT